MKDELVSVIIPVHNKEIHIEATLKSVIAQDYKNIEIILVNDASSDSTLSIAENLLNKSKRNFKIISHEKNSGVSVARNTGFDASNGKYIWFCDGDDLAKINLVSTLVKLAEENDSDISFCGYINRFEDGKPDEFIPVRLDASKSYEAEEITYMRILDKIMPHLCSTLFKRSLLLENNLRSYEGCTACQDRELQLEAFCCAKKFSFSSECLYIYVHGNEMGWIRDNNTQTKKIRRAFHSNEAHYRIAKYLIENGKSERIRFIADNMLMTEAIIKKFTICSRANDKEKFKLLYANKENKGLLKKSLKVFFRKPELFFKSLIISLAPNLYFRIRSKG